MELKNCKIPDAVLAGIGVIGLPDTPALSVTEMQEKFEETARKVIIPRFNALVDQLTSVQGADSIGAQDPCGGTAVTVQQVLQTLKEYADEKLMAAGGGDMKRSVYDPFGRRTDIFAAVDAAKALGLSLYRAVVPLDGFAEQDGGLTQRVMPETVRGAAITAATQLAPPMMLPTGVQNTDEQLAGTLSMLNAGFCETADDGSVQLTVWERPETDIEVYWYGR